MTDITKLQDLPGEWRKAASESGDEMSPDGHCAFDLCADELQAILPKLSDLTERKTEMQLKRYLVIGLKRHQAFAKPTTRLTVSVPKLESHEIAIGIELEIPDSLFIKPALNATITIPEDAVSVPIIGADVVGNIEEIVSRELGVDLTINVLNKEEN